MLADMVKLSIGMIYRKLFLTENITLPPPPLADTANLSNSLILFNLASPIVYSRSAKDTWYRRLQIFFWDSTVKKLEFIELLCHIWHISLQIFVSFIEGEIKCFILSVLRGFF